MGRFVARQPNGRLCIFSGVVDTVTYYNLTEDDYIELKAEQAREEAREDLKRSHFIHPYSEVLDSFLPNNMTEEEFRKLRKKMGEAL